MDNIINLERLNHRSKKRISDLGEVFTPEKYVEDMLQLLSKGKRSFWSNENYVFFEPCCGHGNIVLPIYRKRLEGFYKKNFSSMGKEATFYSVANTINTIWAIDIDSENINSTRERVLHCSLQFMKVKLGYTSEIKLIEDYQDFFSHLLSGIKWHIYENESLSSLSTESNSVARANLTKSGNKWFSENGHNPLHFEQSWCEFYTECEQNGLSSVEFEKSSKFINDLLIGKSNRNKEFSFANILQSKENRNYFKGIGF